MGKVIDLAATSPARIRKTQELDAFKPSADTC